ncbi:hypothetical protein PROFUN_08116 [Planoprotostelium fungivorum]|uniref:UBA domain-containing protein n=1 Tax=Planoprotostelium fungivorum TaxID=1890364 RepID=A0A2P6NKG9_9EUKA|nr:hypothetical protein PROFUN_08116 [Planoprotostelium fungivorum]
MHRIENDAEAVKKSPETSRGEKLQCALVDHDRTVTLEEMQDEEDKDDLFRIIQEEICWDEYGCEVVLPFIQEASDDDEDFPFTGLDDIEEEEEREARREEEEDRELDTDEEEEESYDSDETTTELVSSLLDSVHPPNCRTAEREDEPEYEEDYSSEDIDWDKVPSLKTNSWSDVHEKNVANLIRLVGQLERVETAWVEVKTRLTYVRLMLERYLDPKSKTIGELAREKLRLLAETVVASKPITIKRVDVMESVAARVDPIGPKMDPPAPASMSLLDQAAATLNMNDHDFFSSILPKNNKPSRPEMSVKFEPRVEIIEKREEREVEPQVQVSAPQAHMQDDMEDAAPITYQMPQQQPLFASSMQLLSEMGWYDDDKNRQLLGKHQGDVSEVIRELLDMH